jgi:hypothetical protein
MDNISFFLEISYPILPVFVLQCFSLFFINKSWVSLYFCVSSNIYVYFLVISLLFLCLHVILKIIWINGIKALCCFPFLRACPRRVQGIESWVSRYFLLKKTTLASLGNLPWWKKRDIIEQDILSRCWSRKPPCEVE